MSRCLLVRRWSQNNLCSKYARKALTLHLLLLSLGHIQFFVTSRTAAYQASPSFTISQSLLKLMPIGSMMLSNHLILCHPFLLLSSIFPRFRVFFNELALRIWWPEYWSFRFSNNPSNEYSVFISFRIDWFDLLAVQGNIQGSPPAPQCESINSSLLSLLQLSH